MNTDYVPMVCDLNKIQSVLTKPIWYFLDDEREPPSGDDKYWVIFRDGESMIAMIKRCGMPDGISFDHDLGDGMSGDFAAQCILGMVLDGDLVVSPNFQYDVHSQNCVGAKNIHYTMTDVMKLLPSPLEN